MNHLGALAAVATLAFVALPATAAADRHALTDDLAAVLGAVLYPVQLMAYCHGEIAAEPGFLAAGRQWNARNWRLLANIEERAAAVAVSDEVRRTADEATLAAIVTVVASQADRPAYCRLIAKVIESGYYDIDRRADLAPALKRIFQTDQPGN